MFQSLSQLPIQVLFSEQVTKEVLDGPGGSLSSPQEYWRISSQPSGRSEDPFPAFRKIGGSLSNQGRLEDPFPALRKIGGSLSSLLEYLYIEVYILIHSAFLTDVILRN